MAVQYFDTNISVNNANDTSNPAQVFCLVCGVRVRNMDSARTLHAAWHDSIPAGIVAATGSVGNPNSIGIGASADITVLLNKAMPNTTYAASPMLLTATGTLLGTVAIVGVISQTAVSVTVRVKNNGLSILAANAVVIGVIAVG